MNCSLSAVPSPHQAHGVAADVGPLSLLLRETAIDRMSNFVAMQVPRSQGADEARPSSTFWSIFHILYSSNFWGTNLRGACEHNGATGERSVVRGSGKITRAARVYPWSYPTM